MGVRHLGFSVALVICGCAPSDGANPTATDASEIPDVAVENLKPLPTGVYKQIGGLRTSSEDPTSFTDVTPAIDGFALWVPWNICGDDEACLFAAVQRVLDGAATRGLEVSLAISDGFSVPPGIKASCQLFEFSFRGTPQTMCLAWDPVYLAAKKAFVLRLGDAFDDHPGLAYLYFTGACSTNGNEGHCRVDEPAFVQAGYTKEKLVTAYTDIMQTYREAFPTTPLAFEVHTIFDEDSPWTELWTQFGPSGRVGVAAWWCAERLSLVGRETVNVFPLVQAAATTSFSVCQTVASLADEPYKFSEPSLGLDYGSETAFTPDDVQRAFTETMDWMEGIAVHGGQSAPIASFQVYEAWSMDADEPSFQQRLAAH